MPDTITRAESAPQQAADIDPARSEPVVGNGWILPAVGAVVLTLLWGAYVVVFTTEMVALG